MGHRRHADSPSPIQLLAILAAKDSGVSLNKISRRTRYSESTIMRWWVKWGRESSVFVESINCEAPELFEKYAFAKLYPPGSGIDGEDSENPANVSSAGDLQPEH